MGFVSWLTHKNIQWVQGNNDDAIARSLSSFLCDLSRPGGRVKGCRRRRVSVGGPEVAQYWPCLYVGPNCRHRLASRRSERLVCGGRVRWRMENQQCRRHMEADLR